MGRESIWVQTYTGKKFYPFDPHEEDICIEDIAHSLAMKCRFGGHCKDFYSVAQHSILTAVLAPMVLKDDYTEAIGRWCLLHDAAEAYLADIPSPIKHELSEDFQYIEDNILYHIANRFRLEPCSYALVHRMDLLLLATEKRDLLAPLDWEGSMPDPLSGGIIPQSWIDAERSFLYQFYKLGIHLL